MTNLKLFDYRGNLYDTGIQFDEIQSVGIQVISGDEVAIVCMDDGTELRIDVAELSGKYRMINFFDFSYSIDKKFFKRWSQRKDAYDIWHGRADE